MNIWLVQALIKYDKEMSICLLESDLSFDENVSYFTSMNLYDRKEQFFHERDSYWTDRTNIGTII